MEKGGMVVIEPTRFGLIPKSPVIVVGPEVLTAVAPSTAKLCAEPSIGVADTIGA